jgi:hypothetical protein
MSHRHNHHHHFRSRFHKWAENICPFDLGLPDSSSIHFLANDIISFLFVAE